eukprot:12323-Heterococcus_DN1.PRE.2
MQSGCNKACSIVILHSTGAATFAQQLQQPTRWLLQPSYNVVASQPVRARRMHRCMTGAFACLYKALSTTAQQGSIVNSTNLEASIVLLEDSDSSDSAESGSNETHSSVYAY